ncbi:hypothetical protein GCM10028805_03480 [Spirosoma harenae]
MSTQDAKRIIELLSSDWQIGDYGSEQKKYARYTKVIADLIAATHSIDWSALMLAKIINQAKTGRESSDWIEQEIRFEALAAAMGLRSEYLLYDLKKGAGSDESLDLYNSRLKRLV